MSSPTARLRAPSRTRGDRPDATGRAAATAAAGADTGGGGADRPYLDAADLPGRVNPALHGGTYRSLRAAQALVAKAAELRDALTLMHQRGETELHTATLARALRVLDGERRTARVTVPPPCAS